MNPFQPGAMHQSSLKYPQFSVFGQQFKFENPGRIGASNRIGQVAVATARTPIFTSPKEVISSSSMAIDGGSTLRLCSGRIRG